MSNGHIDIILLINNIIVQFTNYNLLPFHDMDQ